MTKLTNGLITGIAMVVATSAIAQGSNWKAARDAGLVGEKPDGYLGIVGTETRELKVMINDVNIQRKAKYTERARLKNSTVEQYGITIGCRQIENTPINSKYMTPNGLWKTKTSAPPERHPSCI